MSKMVGRRIRNIKGLHIFLILFFFIGGLVFSQDELSAADKKLQEEILAAFKSGGEEGVRNFAKNKKDSISSEFIAAFAQSAAKGKKEEWLKICMVIAEEKKDEKAVADVNLRMGDYYGLVPDTKKAFEYIEKASAVYVKLNDLVGQGNVLFSKGDVYFNSEDNTKATEMYDKALPLFEKAGDPIGQGSVYKRKGDIYFNNGDPSKAKEMYDKAMALYEKGGKTIDF